MIKNKILPRQGLMGENFIRIHEMFLTLKQKQSVPIICTLCSNIATHFEKTSDGSSLKKVSSHLKYLQLKGSKVISKYEETGF